MVKVASRPKRGKKKEEDEDLRMVLKMSEEEQKKKERKRKIQEEDDARSRHSSASQKAKQPRIEDEDAASIHSAKDSVMSERIASRRERRPVSPAPIQKISKRELHECLSYLHKMIARKDNNKFFAFPINDTIAPDYSQVVKVPMDFLTISKKIDNMLYENVMEFRNDVQLICTNAMNYNHPETIYYKAAQKLLEYSTKTLGVERLQQLRKSVPQLSAFTDFDLAVHMESTDNANEYLAPSRKQKRKKDKDSYLTFEPIPDHLPVKDVISISKERATEASMIREFVNPGCKMVVLGATPEGQTTLRFLNPDSVDGKLNEKERVTTVGEKIGKLKKGKPFLEALLANSEAETTKPVHYLQDYGTFSSNAPTYDSTFATATKRESDMLLSAYGSRLGVDYVQSTMEFLSGASNYLRGIIGTHINNSTSGRHGEVQKKLKQMHAQDLDKAVNTAQSGQSSGPSAVIDQSTATTESPTNNSALGDKSKDKESFDDKETESVSKGDDSKSVQSDTPKPTANSSVEIDLESLKSLSELGIDTSFLDSYKPSPYQQQLDEVSLKLKELKKKQEGRLAKTPGIPNKAAVIPEDESKTAKQVASELVKLIGAVEPEVLCKPEAIQEILGVAAVEIEQTTPCPPSPNLESEGLPEPSATPEPHIPVSESPTA